MQVLDTVDLDAIRALHERGEFFWLDLVSPGDPDLDALGTTLEIPDLAIEDTKEFGQRPKIDEYVDRVLIDFGGSSACSRSWSPSARCWPAAATRSRTCPASSATSRAAFRDVHDDLVVTANEIDYCASCCPRRSTCSSIKWPAA